VLIELYDLSLLYSLSQTDLIHIEAILFHPVFMFIRLGKKRFGAHSRQPAVGPKPIRRELTSQIENSRATGSSDDTSGRSINPISHYQFGDTRRFFDAGPAQRQAKGNGSTFTVFSLATQRSSMSELQTEWTAWCCSRSGWETMWLAHQERLTLMASSP
jgi:hypothetical protein